MARARVSSVGDKESASSTRTPLAATMRPDEVDDKAEREEERSKRERLVQPSLLSEAATAEPLTPPPIMATRSLLNKETGGDDMMKV